MKNLSVHHFSGFYNSIWNNSDAFYYANDYFETEGLEYDFEDYDAYTKEISAKFFDLYEDYILEMFPGGMIQTEYAGLYSPKYYNFETDKILYNLEILDSQAFRTRCLELIAENKDYLTQKLKDTFTSRSGFTSFYSAKFEDFKDSFKNLEEDNEIYLAHLIYWIIDLENPDIEIELYEELNGNGYSIENYMQVCTP